MALLIISTLFGSHIFFLDGFLSPFLYLIFKDSTIFSKNYSNRSFKKIKIGMTKEKVINILGQPLYKGSEFFKNYNAEIERWWYSKSSASSHYKLREIRFKNSLVFEKVHYYYTE